jgi:transcriptional regulator with XRE-family HTH domain
MEEFWATVNRLIKESSITQEVLAETIGVSKNTLYSWIANSTLPRADAAYRIAAALGVSVEYLVTGAEPGKPDTTPLIEQAQALLDGLKRL